MIELIVSDVGKVILPFDAEPVWEHLIAACPECTDTRGIFHQVFAEAQLGRGLTDPEEFYRRLVHATGMTLSFEEFCRIWSDMFWEDKETIDLILAARVRERHLLSNTNVIHWGWIEARHPDLISRFDRLWLSHEMGLEKPDPAIYEQVIRGTGLPPEKHVFIDDIPENVAAAESVGMAAILHTDAANLARQFERLGLKG